MNASSRWINDYLDRPATADEQADLLTMAGFPIESRHEVAEGAGGPDTCLDVELTSNRGDCLCHVGLAREIAATSGRSLKWTDSVNKATGPSAATTIAVENREPKRCPIYTARIIRGVKVGPSPARLADRLRAIGQIPRNNIVDATNFVLFELGQPTHVFDLAKVRGGRIIVRMAKPDEPFLPIGEGEKEIKLRAHDLVIADAEAPIAIGGVKGGALSAVTNATTDILIEAATFDPVTVRTTGRQLRIESASAYRYERGVRAAQVNPAAERLVEIILQVAGGTLCEGVVSDGAPIAPPMTVALRPARCRRILGVNIEDAAMISILERLGLAPAREADRIVCRVPAHRPDIEREIDLIEEVARVHGLAKIPVVETISVRVAPPQGNVMARRALSTELAGMGFVETVTHTLVSEQAASAWLSPRETMLQVEDERAKAEPVLRPSILPSLLRVRSFNENHGSGFLRLFEIASTFACIKTGHRESRCLGLLADVESEAAGLRPLRGAIERVVEVLCGPGAALDVAPAPRPWLARGTGANITLGNTPLGWLGVIDRRTASTFGVTGTVAAAEIDLAPLLAGFPPATSIAPLPAFPAIERDLSAIVAETTSWESVRSAIDSLRLEMLESCGFVTAFRGKPIEKGKKSVTLRLRFRAADRTLRHEEADRQVAQAMSTLKERLGAEIRA